MLLDIPNVLSADQVREVRAELDAASWVDGRITAGHQGARVKDNEQLPTEHPTARRVGELILRELGRNPLFISAALPLQILPPLFNRYGGGQQFGTHVDGSIRQLPNGARIRTDLSCTLFLSEPDEYDGGELQIEDVFGARSVKLPAGHMILYPSTSLHRVTPVTRGTRVSSFFWLQSLIRDNHHRSLLFDLDIAIQRFGPEQATHPSVVQLTGIYHNLIRLWAEM